MKWSRPAISGDKLQAGIAAVTSEDGPRPSVLIVMFPFHHVEGRPVCLRKLAVLCSRVLRLYMLFSVRFRITGHSC